jgi:Domain of unknown function (DUF1996)
VRGLLLIAAGGVVVGLLGSAALAGNGKRPGTEPVSRADLRGVNFVENCLFSHRASDDPIVFPGQAGASHDHTFVGNRSTSASSTHDSLRAASTTCRRKADTAAYWVPTLFAGGTAVLPDGATVYYRRPTVAEVEPFPDNLRMIAGNAKATSPQDPRVTFWNCGIAGGVPRSSTIPTCPNARGSFLRLHIRFPSCWNGTTLDSADHQSHMAYAMRGACPTTHPVALPAIELIVRYRTLPGQALGASTLELSSGGQLSAHGDFLNAWRPQALERLVDGCLNALVQCGRS